MNGDGYSQAKELFLATCELPAGERSAVLDSACDGDEELRRRVEELLAHDLGDGSDATQWRSDVHPGAIDNYRLVERIGSGGMGDVWKAEQLSPVRRWVALKLIRATVASKVVLARFEAERQALALMNHPNIATVFEAGETEHGQPFFAMELIQGEPITEYCDSHRLGLPGRLELFSQVCSGVQHAHQRGVIHRDIKPSNILVTDDSGRPVPKIIDFGVAKATSMPLTERTLLTEQGLWIGTPEYMSPEQAGLTEFDVDTRTDVYALGVLLYELLVGTQPFAADALRCAGFGEMCRILREEEPPRPSTRVSTLGEHTDAVARKRGTDGATLSRLLRGDLDWVVMKALEKERNRRYGTPADLAGDVLRYLENEPVLARPPSVSYRLRKFVARNRAAVAAGVGLVVALIVAVVGTTTGMVRARHQAEAAGSLAESMAAVLETLNPGASVGQLQTARRALSEGAEVIENQLADQPMVRGRLLMMMGQTHLVLTDFDRAAELLEQTLDIWRAELGDDHPALADVYQWLGSSHSQRGDFKSALAAHERAATLYELSAGPDDVSTGWALASIGQCLTRLGDYERSRSLLDKAERIIEAAHGPESDYMAGVLHFKGMLLMFLGELDGAETALKRSVANRERWLGRDHTGVAGPLAELAMVRSLMGDLDLAEAQFRRALEINRRAFGGDHLALAYPLRELGRIEMKRGDLDSARRLIESALEIGEKSLGPHHADLIWTLQAHGVVLRRSGDAVGARSAFERALAIAESTLGPNCFEMATILQALGYLEYEFGHLDPARANYDRAGEILTEVFPASHRRTGVNCYQRSCLAALQGNRDRAIALLGRALATDWEDDIVFEDPDLDSLRGDPEFEAILADLRRRLDG